MEVLTGGVGHVYQVFLGTPPVARGGNSAPVELECVEAGAHVFAEKPVSLAPTDDVASYSTKLSEAAAAYSDGPRVISVGYMFRHSAAVAKAREIIAADGNDRVMAVLARYNSACTPLRCERDCAYRPVTCVARACSQTLRSTTPSGGTRESRAARSWNRYGAAMQEFAWRTGW